jgi:prepilin peptidase CpaA
MLAAPIEFRAVITGTLLIVLAFAVREDLLRQRIPNTLNAAALFLGLTMASLTAGWSGFINSFGGALVGCAALVPFYLLRGMGAGDVKLMAAAGSFMGPSSALLAAAMALVAGASLAVAIIVWRLVESRPHLDVSSASGTAAAWRAAATISTVRHERFPYAVAIGVGVVGALWLQGLLGSLVTALGIG